MKVLFPWLMLLLLPFINPAIVTTLVVLWLPLVALVESVIESANFRNLLK
jgi:hypothetical protein